MELRNADEVLACHCGWQGKVGEMILTASGPHIRADCPVCGGYVKFVAQSEARLYFGKYKGKTPAEVASADPAYLDWLVSTDGPRLSGGLRSAIDAARVVKS